MKDERSPSTFSPEVVGDEYLTGVPATPHVVDVVLFRGDTGRWRRDQVREHELTEAQSIWAVSIPAAIIGGGSVGCCLDVLSDVVGLVPREVAGTARTWRNDGRAHRVLVEEGPANDATVLGFSLPTAAEAVVARSASLDYTVTEASTELCGQRQVERIWELGGCRWNGLRGW